MESGVDGCLNLGLGLLRGDESTVLYDRMAGTWWIFVLFDFFFSEDRVVLH